MQTGNNSDSAATRLGLEPFFASRRSPPASEILYVAFFAPVTVASTTEATGTLIVDAGGISYDGSAIWVEFFAPNVTPAAAGRVTFSVFEGTTQIGRIASTLGDGPLMGRMKVMPTVGAHDYKITGFQAGGNATVNADVGGTGKYANGYVRVLKV